MAKQYATPGPRTMKPEVATDPAVNRCSLGAQLLFDRLIVNADDQGRQIGDPIVVKAACFPRCAEASLARVKAWLGELATERLVLRYEADGEPLVQLTGWWRHQDNQRRIFPSRWPAPDGWADRKKVEPGRLPADPPPYDGPWPADGPPDAGHSPANGAPNAGTWPREVSPSPMPMPVPLAVASANASAAAVASAPAGAGERGDGTWFDPAPRPGVERAGDTLARVVGRRAGSGGSDSA